MANKTSDCIFAWSPGTLAPKLPGFQSQSRRNSMPVYELARVPGLSGFRKMAAPASATSGGAPAIVVADARFCSPEATAFAVTNIISVTGHDFTVTDITGAAVMHVEAEVFAFLQRRSVLLEGAERRPVLTMRDAGLFMGSQWDVFRGDSTSRRNKLFSAVRSSAFQTSRTKMYVYLAGNAGERAPEFVIRGNNYDGAYIVCTGNSEVVIAQITRQNTTGGALLGRHTYTARINPGIDRAFILALTVILYEMRHNRQGSRT